MEFQRQTKISGGEPRCPFCYKRMEEVQLVFQEDPRNPPNHCWMEVWGCDSCSTNHVFPARIEWIQYALGSELSSKGNRIVEHPK